MVRPPLDLMLLKMSSWLGGDISGSSWFCGCMMGTGYLLKLKIQICGLVDFRLLAWGDLYFFSLVQSRWVE